MLPFEDLLSRADAELLQELLSKNVVQLLAALTPDRVSAPSLKRVLLDLRSDWDLLLSPSSRRLLLELLRPNEARELVSHLGGPTERDPYQQLADLKVRRRSSAEALLLSFFAVPAPPEEAQLEPAKPIAEADYPLFAHQRRALRAAAKFLHAPPHKALVHMPTGAGKTRTAMNFVAEHLRQVEPGFVLWLAASEELCDQAADEFQRAWKFLGNRALPVHRWWGADKLPSDIPHDGLAVAGLAKVYSRCIEDIPWQARLGDGITLLIFDEAHQAIAPTYRHVVEAIRARRPAAGLLGLSATPGRSWNDVEADRVLADFFSQQKVMLEVDGYDNAMQYLIDERYLARPSFRHVSALGPELSDKDRLALGESLDIPPSLLKRLADDHLRNLSIVKEVREMVTRHRRILVFAATVEHAELLAAVLSSLGIASRSVTGATAPSLRADAIRWYRDSQAQDARVLTNFGVLTTGFDAPKTSAALIARPTKSLVLYSQMVGRAIRGTRAGGNAEAEIVTVVDTGLPGFRDVTEAFTNWEDVWQKAES